MRRSWQISSLSQEVIYLDQVKYEYPIQEQTGDWLNYLTLEKYIFNAYLQIGSRKYSY